MAGCCFVDNKKPSFTACRNHPASYGSTGHSRPLSSVVSRERGIAREAINSWPRLEPRSRAGGEGELLMQSRIRGGKMPGASDSILSFARI